MVFMPIYTGVITGLIVSVILADNKLVEGGLLIALSFISVRLGSKISEFASNIAAKSRTDVVSGDYIKKGEA